jgi:predicted nucleotidyltransferase component of viral defense system
MELSNAQAVEFFHVAFLSALTQRLETERYALKGGANLRYFFESQRYSEDIDLDIVGEEPWGMKEKVSAVIDSPLLGTLLRVGGLSVGEWSATKQTKTTRRWKVGVMGVSRGEIRTKIEFSNRGHDEDLQVEAVPERIVAPYALRAPLVQHYGGVAATAQKVAALALRKETQARDVFDLDLLLRRFPPEQGSIARERLDKAAALALGIPYDAFEDQVLRFLENEVVDYYRPRAAWDQMRLFVAEKLEAAR